MSYTTEDCKNFLIQQYSNTKKSEWKRTKKYTDRKGSICRDFSNTKHNLNVSLKETNYGLVEFVDNEVLNNNPPKTYGHVDMNTMLFGGGITKTNHLSNYEDKFLIVIKNGIDWEENRYNRSSFDFAKHINFDNLVQKESNLLSDYLQYMYSAIELILSLDETYICYSICIGDNEDSFIDLLDVLNRIIDSYKKLNKVITGNYDINTLIISCMEKALETMSETEEEDMDNAYLVVEKIGSLLQQLN